MNQKKKSKYIGLFGALGVHIAMLLLLFLVGFSIPKPQEEGGVPVMLGDVPDALGSADPSLVKVDVMPEPTEVPDVEPVSEPEQEIITQEEEETVAIKPQTKPTPKPKKPVIKTKEQKVKKPEKTAAEKAAEAKRLAAEKAERERKAAEEAARKRVSNAFGRGAKMADKGTGKGKGVQGTPTGNSNMGAMNGAGGYGSFNLNGRSLGPGGLPRPVYNVQDEGRVVVAITVNPQGQVINTSIHPMTNTVNPSLRKAAEEAAKKARFNTVSGVNNQRGTITYTFNLK